MKFKDKVVWITGATSGIGEALAYEFADQGAKLILSSIQKEELEEVKTRCLEKVDFCLTQYFDLGNADEIEEAAKTVLEKVDTIDVLINNGGISQRSLIIDTPLEIDHKIMNIDFFGAVQLTKLVLPTMIKNGGIGDAK